jgi:hypothetical protein
MRSLTRPVAEQHDAEERGLEEECGDDFVGEQWTGDVADRVHEARPVGAELEAHRDAADHAQRKAQGEHLHPEAVGLHPFRVGGGLEAQLEEQQHPGQCDRDRREQDVEADVGANCMRASMTGSSEVSMT